MVTGKHEIVPWSPGELKSAHTLSAWPLSEQTQVAPDVLSWRAPGDPFTIHPWAREALAPLGAAAF